MTDAPEAAKKAATRSKAEIITQMTKEAQRVERKIGAASCIVICFFEEAEGDSKVVKNIRVQDAGRFPMPPNEFYELMIRAHEQGLMSLKPPKSKILRPN